MVGTLTRMTTRILQEVPMVIMISMLDENIISECHELIENLITTGVNSTKNTLRMYFFVEEDTNPVDEMMTFYDCSDMIMKIVSIEIDTLLGQYKGRIVNDSDESNDNLVVNMIPCKLRKNFKLEIHMENNKYCDIIYIQFCPESIVS
jgi:hypothetical protein